jgi:hypothetical protein
VRPATSLERGHTRGEQRRRFEVADHRRRLLLRASGKRPRDRRPGENGKSLASLHPGHLSGPAWLGPEAITLACAPLDVPKEQFEAALADPTQKPSTAGIIRAECARASDHFWLIGCYVDYEEV